VKGPRTRTERTWSLYALMGVLVFQGLSGLGEGLVLVVGYQPEPPLQLIYGVVGIVILALASFPAGATVDPS
jgi:hypothetical protein